MSVLPTGIVTYLLTDIAGSTRLWEEHPDAMRDAHPRHSDVITACVPWPPEGRRSSPVLPSS